MRFRTHNPELKTVLLLSAFSLLPSSIPAQQPQTNDASNTQPLYSVNAKYVQGVGPGYWPTAGSGLTLNLSAGTSFCGNPPLAVFYAGGKLTMAASATNYVYLDPTNSCLPASNTTGFSLIAIPIATVITTKSNISSITDVRVSGLRASACTVDASGNTVCAPFADVGAGPAPAGAAVRILPQTNAGDGNHFGFYYGPAPSSFNPYLVNYGYFSQQNVFASLTPANNAATLSALTEDDSTNFSWASFYAGAFSTNSSGVRSIVTASQAEADQLGAGAATQLVGQGATVDVEAGSVTQAMAFDSQGVSASAGNIGSAYGVYVASNTAPGGTLTNNYGLYIEDQTAGTNNWAIKTGKGLVSFGDAVTGFEDKGGQVFNVKAYGAKCDGTTDDTAAINAAGTAAGSLAIGAIIFLPSNALCYAAGHITVPAHTTMFVAGSLSVAEDIYVGNYARLTGSGLGSQVSLAAGASVASIVRALDQSGAPGGQQAFYVDHLQILGNDAGGASVSVAALDTRGSFDSSTFHDLLIYGVVGGAAIYVSGSNPPTGDAGSYADIYNIWADTEDSNPVIKIENPGTGYEQYASFRHLDLVNSSGWCIDVENTGGTLGGIRYFSFFDIICAGSQGMKLNGLNASSFNNVTFHGSITGNGMEIENNSNNVGLTFREIRNAGSLSGSLIADLKNSYTIPAGIQAVSYSTPDTGHINYNFLADKIGINTLTPGAPLDVNGVIRGSDSSGVSLGQDGGHRRWQGYASKPNIRALDTSNSYATVGVGSLSVGQTQAGNDPGNNNLNVQGLITATVVTITKDIVTGVNTVAFSATPTFDASLGNNQKITLTGNVTSSTLSNAAAGESINFVICQDGSGSHTFTWPTNVKGGMTIGSTASKCNAQNFIFDGTNAYAISAGVTNM